jgi:chloride channel protein, CIC family
VELSDPSRTAVARLRAMRRSPAQWLGSPVLLALAVGAGAGLGAIAFRELIIGLTRLFTGHAEYGVNGREGNPLLGIGPWFLLLAPVVGGLLYGPLLSRFAPEARGHGVPEVMLAVARGGGRIRPRVALVKSLASGLCIGSGGSVGREGPIVQIGAALGSAAGQLARVPESRMRLLVACGAAGGISATFNAPIAGVFFALEVILRDWAVESFGVVVVSSVVANAISRAALGDAAFLPLEPFHVTSAWQYALFAGLGVVGVVVGLSFTRVLYGLEDLADRVWRGPQWLRPAVGGVLLGALLFAVPQLYGVGYGVLEKAVGGGYATAFLVALLLGKMLATSLTIAIGGSGGVFAPSLFMGAMAGTAYGDVAHAILPGVAGSAGAFGVVGMAAVFAAAARAPVTAVMVIIELTGDYAIVLPLMLGVVVAAGLAQLVTRDTIYTLKLRRRGIDIDAAEAPLPGLRVADAMSPGPRPAQHDDSLEEVVRRLAGSGLDAIPVIDGDGRYLGVLAALDAERRAADGDAQRATAADLARQVPALTPGEDLGVAMHRLAAAYGGVPVLDDSGERLLGWIDHRDVVRAYAAALGNGMPAGADGAPADVLAPTSAASPS